MLIVGLTGGIASGKTTVSTMFHEAGIPIIDADVISREVVEPGTTVLEKIKLTFGPQIIKNGVLDRQQLGDTVFGNEANLSQLNAIIQPAISNAIQDKLAFWRTQKAPIVILDVPLLVERGYHENDSVDQVIVVTVSEATQLARLKARNQLDDYAANNRIKSQLLLSEKVKVADYVIDNNGTLAATREQVAQVIAKLKEIAPEYAGK
ncbi:dephospho-CoA kinase [Leuconostoc fallax]|uniref:dephospho-CoA kinase n=1 Tax=Leuconostoc fallax TaxID=1251 RepID=UPI002090CED5|nr:dephospho-CoA kinase [Leuconostoc fallax]MCO6183466.1 dephospho-CoA kinase [Leuconostoc fallax]